jgi:hypothetical protein
MSDSTTTNEGRWQDPIVAEVRRAREALLQEVGYDLHELCERLRRQQEYHSHLVVRRQPRSVLDEEDRVA